MAKHAHAELERLSNKMRQDKQSMFQALAELIGQPTETERTRLVWAGLVRFANADIAEGLSTDEGLALRAAIALCVHGHPDLEEVQGDVYKLEFFQDVYQVQKLTGIGPEEALSTIAVKLHPEVRRLLAWIADPNRTTSDDRHAALSFLLEHGEQELTQYEFDPNAEFDTSGNSGYPLFYWKRPRSFETVMAPLARFIFERLEQYNDGDLALEEATPIVLCRREGCGKFSVSQRRTKDFCSASCRTLHRQKEKAGEHAAYMRQYRENNYTKPFPRRKLK